jgi:hypothetical protein
LLCKTMLRASERMKAIISSVSAPPHATRQCRFHR